jgi:hypothetical protein
MANLLNRVSNSFTASSTVSRVVIYDGITSPRRLTAEIPRPVLHLVVYQFRVSASEQPPFSHGVVKVKKNDSIAG